MEKKEPGNGNEGGMEVLGIYIWLHTKPGKKWKDGL